MSNKWKAGDSEYITIRDLISTNHQHLVDVMDDIVVIFKERASKKGTTVIYGKTSKAPAILSLLGERPYQFVLEIGFDHWNTMLPAQKRALLDHLLCFIGGEEDEQTAEMKYYLREPDVYYFSEEIERNGHWRQELADLLSQDDNEGEEGALNLLDEV